MSTTDTVPVRCPCTTDTVPVRCPWTPTGTDFATLDNPAVRERVLLYLFEHDLADSDIAGTLAETAPDLVRDSARTSAFAVAAVCYWSDFDWENAEWYAEIASMNGSRLGELVADAARAHIAPRLFRLLIASQREKIVETYEATTLQIGDLS